MYSKTMGWKMSCGLEGINDKHRHHFCHLCKNRYDLGSLPPSKTCRECLDLHKNICHFEEDLF